MAKKEKAIRTFLIDVDGVLTDGRLNINSENGKVFKSFSTKDVAAIRMLIQEGVKVIVISADDHLTGKHFANKVGAKFVYSRKKFDVPVNWETCAGIGDDVYDLGFLERCAKAFCPKDCIYPVTLVPGIIQLESKGGEGCIAEIYYKDLLK